MDTPRVYIACLASYNAGTLHGKWVDAVDADVIREAIKEVIATSPTEGAEEWGFHDYEGIPSDLGENPDIEELAACGAFIEEHEELGLAVLNHFCGRLDEAKTALEDNYQGGWKSLEDYAENFLDDTGAFQGAPDMLKQYFDFEKFARDLELGGDVYTLEVNGEVHVFSNH